MYNILERLAKISIFGLVLTPSWGCVPRRAQGPRVVTALAPPGGIRLLAVGDTGSGDANQMEVARAMEDRCVAGASGGVAGDSPQHLPVSGLLLLGDLFYMTGVESTADPQWEEKIWKPYGGPCLSNVPIYPVLGNHDYRGSVEAWLEMAARVPRWRMPDRFYEIRWGNLLELVGLDTERLDWCLDSDRCALGFLRSFPALETARGPDAGGRPWRLAMGHHPVLSESTKGWSHAGLSRDGILLGGGLCGRMDAYLAGHSHHLEHRSFAQCPLEQFIVGGGGGELVDIPEDHHDRKSVKYARSRFGFLEIVVSHGKIRWAFVSAQGEEIYRYEQVRRGVAVAGP